MYVAKSGPKSSMSWLLIECPDAYEIAVRGYLAENEMVMMNKRSFIERLERSISILTAIIGYLDSRILQRLYLVL
jgi:hypothetical protein